MSDDVKSLAIAELEHNAAIVDDQVGILGNFAAHIVDVPDEDLPRFYMLVDAVRRDQVDNLGAILSAVRREMLRRMTERGAEGIPDREFEIALDRQYTTYDYDLDKLREAREYLSAEDATKVIKFVPEHTQTIPESWVPGAPVSIKALAKKYRGTYVADLLTAGMTRRELEPRVVVKARKTVKNITRQLSVIGASA